MVSVIFQLAATKVANLIANHTENRDSGAFHALLCIKTIFMVLIRTTTVKIRKQREHVPYI